MERLALLQLKEIVLSYWTPNLVDTVFSESRQPKKEGESTHQPSLSQFLTQKTEKPSGLTKVTYGWSGIRELERADSTETSIKTVVELPMLPPEYVRRLNAEIEKTLITTLLTNYKEDYIKSSTISYYDLFPKTEKKKSVVGKEAIKYELIILNPTFALITNQA